MRSRYKTERARDVTDEVKKAVFATFATGEKATASLIARRAGINRSTFYRHFYDVEDVISSIEDDIFQDVEEVLAGLDYEGGNVPFFHEVVALVEKYIPFLNYLIRAGGMSENRFFQRIIIVIKSCHDCTYQDAGNTVPGKSAGNLSEFLVSGIALNVSSDIVPDHIQ